MVPQIAFDAANGMRATIRRAMPLSVTHVVRQLRKRWPRRNCRDRLGIGLEPLSFRWGLDRGQEIARFYVEQFLSDFYDH